MALKGHGGRKEMKTKIAFEEPGKRNERSSDVYLPRRGMKEAALCSRCNLVYQNKGWSLNEVEARKLKEDGRVRRGTCPACRRMEDNLPAGIVTFSGDYFRVHEVEILDLIRNEEARARVKNPLGRVMEIAQEGNTMTVTTTEEKLAQKLGKEVYRAHKGELRYQWAHDEKMVRVNWAR